MTNKSTVEVGRQGNRSRTCTAAALEHFLQSWPILGNRIRRAKAKSQLAGADVAKTEPPGDEPRGKAGQQAQAASLGTAPPRPPDPPHVP